MKEELFYLSMDKFGMSATQITHFMDKSVADFENVTKQPFIFEHHRGINKYKTF